MADFGIGELEVKEGLGRWTGDGEEMGKKREEIAGWRKGFLDVLERKERRDGKEGEGWGGRERERRWR